MEREVRDPRASGMGMDHGHSSRQAQQWPNPGQMRCRVYGTGCRLWGTGYRMQGAEYGVQGCEVQAVGCRSSQGAWVSMPMAGWLLWARGVIPSGAQSWHTALHRAEWRVFLCQGSDGRRSSN